MFCSGNKTKELFHDSHLRQIVAVQSYVHMYNPYRLNVLIFFGIQKIRELSKTYKKN